MRSTRPPISSSRYAHNGAEKGVTPGGIRVRNVALPVIKTADAVYCMHS